MLRHRDPYAGALLEDKSELVNPCLTIHQAGNRFKFDLPSHSAVFIEMDIKIEQL